MIRYEIGTNWKINVDNKNGTTSLYTGEIIEEDDNNIKISTIKNEIRVIRKEEISQSKRLNGATHESH